MSKGSKQVTSIDVDRCRADTPGVNEKLHFNNAGAALMPKLVLDAVVAHLELEAQIGGYEAHDLKFCELEHVYDAAAKLINCQSDEIAIIENATRAWDMAFYSLPFKPGDRILTGQAEYVSNYMAFLQAGKRTGVTVDVVPDDKSGQLDVAALEKMIDKSVKLIAVTHVPSAGGLVNPAAQIGKLARAAKITYLLDACQSVGQMPVDVKEIGCDILTTTGRKFLRGPRGTGFLYMNKALLETVEPPFVDLHAAEWTEINSYKLRPDARRFESWEAFFAGRVGLAAAIDYALEVGLEAIEERVVWLADHLRAKLAELPGIVVRDQGKRRCGIVTFTTDGAKPSELKLKLREREINVSVSTAAYNRLDLDSRSIDEVIRASVHYYNTDEEVDRFCRELSQLLENSN